ncbi:MAG: hypothetical protein AB1705_12025 [Verrucomicrobiota bacterium]
MNKIICLLLITVAGAFTLPAQTAYTWNGTTGSWTDSARWTPNGVPGAADTANISSGTVNVDTDTSVDTLNFTNATLNGSATLTVGTAFHWAGGTINGTGTLTLQGSVNGTISGGNTKFLDGGRVLNNAGTLVWTGGSINLNLGTWNNSGLLDCQSDNTMSDASGSGAGSFFNNTGTVRKSVATGTTTFNAVQSFANSGTVELLSGSLTLASTPFHNNGTARTQAGTLTLGSGGGTGGGTFEAISPGLVSFTSGTHTLTNNARLIGTGTNRVAGATVTLEDAVGAERLEITSGTINGTGTVTVTNGLYWSGGTVGGTGTLTLLGSVNGTISGGNTKFIDGGRVLNNAGTLVWTGGSINLNLGTWNNSGLLDCQGNNTMSDASGSNAGSFFNNTGTVRKSAGTGTTTFNALQSFANSGLLEVLSGIVSVPGTYSMTSSSTHRFGLGGTTAGTGYGRLLINGAATLDGAVEVVLVNGFNPAAGNTFLVVTFTSRTGAFASFSAPSGIFSEQYYGTSVAIRTLGAATYTWNGANANWGDPTQWTPNGVPGSGDTANIGSGSAAVGSATTVSILNLSGGEVSGVGPLNIAGTFNWTGGVREGPGLTVIPPGAVLNLSGSASKGFYYHTLENSGTINWDGTGAWSGHSGPVLSNLASGVINMSSDASMTRFNNAVIIHNAGLIRKTGGTGTKTMTVTFSNTGTLEVNSGKLLIDYGFTNRNQVNVAADCELVINGNAGASSGQFQVGANGYVSYTGGNQALETNAVVSGDGFLNVSGANLAVKGTISVQKLQLVSGTISGLGPLNVGGTFNWTGGNREGPGVTAIEPGAVLNLSGSSAKGFYYHTLQNAGTINWDGSGALGGHSGPVLSNLTSGVINLMSDAALTRFNSSAVIHNAGLIRKTGGTGTKTMDVVLTNSGTLDIRTGVLSIVNSYVPTATSTNRFAVGGYDVGTGYGRLTASGTVALAGHLDLMLTNSFVPTNNATFAVLTAGTRTGTFSSVSGRGIGGGLYFNPVYSGTAVTLTVADGTPFITAGSAAWVDGKFQFRLNGIASENYRIDASTNLVDWAAISTNAIPGTAYLDFVDNDSPNFPHRFYRGVFLP